jgi:hypothetical protein
MNTNFIAIIFMILSMVFLFFFEGYPSWQESFFVHSTYFFMMGLIGIWAFLSTRSIPCWETIHKMVRNHSKIIMTVCLLSVWLCTSVPFDLRVLADESNLISTSRNLFEHKEFHNSISGKFYYDNYHSTHTTIPIRPPLFAFVLSLIHSIFGYAPENVAWMNLASWMGIIGLCCLYAQRSMRTSAAIATSLFLFSIPILSLCARSGGFDIFSLFLLGMVFHSLRTVDTDPNETSLWMLWVYLLLFIHTRYENIAILFIIIPYLLIVHRIHFQKHLTLWISIGTFFLLPKWFQMRLSVGQYENEGESLLSFFNLYTHSLSFAQTLINFEWSIPYNNILNILGVIGLGILCQDIYSKRYSKRILIEISTMILFSFIFLAHFLGDPQNQTSLRFFLILNVGLGLLGIYTLHRIKYTQHLLPLLSILFCFCYHPISVHNDYMNALVYPREARIVYDFLKPHRGSNTMLLVDMPGAFVIENIGSLSIEYANLNIDILQTEFEQRLYERLLVVQRIDHTTLNPIESDILNDRYLLISLQEHQTSDEYYLRIAEVINIDDE